MTPHNFFQKLKSFVTEVITAQVATHSDKESIAIRQEKKTALLESLWQNFPEQLNAIFWDVSSQHASWGKPREWSPEEIQKIVHKHITERPRRASEHLYSTMLCQVADYWLASDVLGMEQGVGHTLVNLRVTDTSHIIPGIHTLYKLEKEDASKPALCVYTYSTGNGVVLPYFHFVE